MSQTLTAGGCMHTLDPISPPKTFLCAFLHAKYPHRPPAPRAKKRERGVVCRGSLVCSKVAPPLVVLLTCTPYPLYPIPVVASCVRASVSFCFVVCWSVPRGYRWLCTCVRSIAGGVQPIATAPNEYLQRRQLTGAKLGAILYPTRLQKL